jgi:hypothetical protein
MTDLLDVQRYHDALIAHSQRRLNEWVGDEPYPVVLVPHRKEWRLGGVEHALYVGYSIIPKRPAP